MRKYEKVSDCPPALAEYLRLVNLLPYEFSLENFKRHLQMIEKEFKDFETSEIPNTPPFSRDDRLCFLAMKKCLDNVPKEFRSQLEKLANEAVNESKTSSNVWRLLIFHSALRDYYVKFYYFYKSINLLVDQLEKERKLYREGEWRDTNQVLWLRQPIRLPSLLIRDSKGLLTHTGVASMIGKIDDRRLRRCPICKKIYWAKKVFKKDIEQSCGLTKCVERLGNNKRSKKEVGKK